MQDSGFWRDDFRSVIALKKGFSASDKYVVELEDGKKLLLRVKDISHYDKELMKFKKLQEIAKLDIRCPKPVEIGVFNDGASVYTLSSWVDGMDCRDIIGGLSIDKQYELGCKAGRALREIHSLSWCSSDIEHTSRYKETIQTRIKNYYNCGTSFSNAEKMIDYLRSNLQLLDTAPLCIRHGDYHIGNMVVTLDNEIGIIDFDSLGYGYAYEDFDGILWCLEVSEYFATGRINGYFNDNIPDDFFKLLALFLTRAVISSIPWAMKFDDKQVEIALTNAKILLDGYGDMSSIIPKWYLGTSWKE